MEMSHVADDYAAIARRLKELQEETLRAEERAAQPIRRVEPLYQMGRAPHPAGEAYQSSHR